MTARQLSIFDVSPATDSTVPSQRVASIPTPPKSGRQLREAGMASSAKHAGDAWMARAIEAVRVAAQRLGEITTDDVKDVMGDDAPPHGCAFGSVMRVAARKGIVTKAVGQVRETSRAQAHCRPQQIWKRVS